MSELTERVRKMLSQAQVFARDTPFEAVSRARQTLQAVDDALAACAPDERPALENLRQLASTRLAKYEQRLEAWLDESRARGDKWEQSEQAMIGLPLRAKV